jgi:cardiolipin synthase
MNDVGMIGTVNLDNRSLRLNFQITLAFAHADFASEIAVMLERDFARCDELDELYVHRLPLHTRIDAHCARLFAPVL